MECVVTEDFFIKSISAMSKVEFEHRCRRLHNVLDENDLSSSMSFSHKGTDPLPLVISTDDWKTIEAGVAQRAKLFNALASDIYGEQRLWKEGKLPAALLFANPDFLQVVWKVRPAGGIFVNLASTDVVRLQDGSFVAVADHLQVPEGLGRALENRIGVSRAFPELFRSMRTERLAVFFKKLMDGLDDMHKEIHTQGEPEKVVLLASGPENPRRAEDAVIARYLGIPLVENDDLAIRNMQVYMKTLMGLKKIGTIFRRVEDGMCDPLELRIDSGEGAVGLISTVRAGNVAIANFLGTGVLESPMFKPFLPEICRELLGEELLLRDVETLWLGNADDAEHVMAEPEKWIFKKAFRDAENFKETEPKAYASMTTTAQLALLQAVEEAPEQWVAEKSIDVATVYTYRETPQNAAQSNAAHSDSGKTDGPEFTQAVAKMRFFAVNTASETVVMPGGHGILDDGLGEKDIWVLSEKPVANFSLLAPASQTITPSRASGNLPSRAAENLFRLGRDLSASNMMARIARGIAVRLSDESWMDMPELPWILKAGLSDESQSRLALDPENALRYFILRKDNKDGMQCVLTEIRDLGMQLRDRISEDLWLYLNGFGIAEMPAGPGAAALLPYLKAVLSDSAAVAGLAADSMTRGHEWRFLELGREIESAIRTLELIKDLLTTVPNDEMTNLRLLQAVLEIGDGLMTYHRRYGGRLQIVPVIDLLLSDESNPRSVAYQVAKLREASKHLPGNNQSEATFSPLDRELMRVLAELRLANIEQLAETKNNNRENLIKLLDEQISSIERIAEIVTRLYLSHAPRAGVIHATTTNMSEV
jgi:uncharacterized circularly permuted ATP-grasp superfamily protein/uncharacterized alpha-E superfamily protein